MYLELLIKQLKKAKTLCFTNQDRTNVMHNIKICEMQIRLRDKVLKVSKR